MDDFKNFLKENNYEDDLEFQLCDLEMAFNAGKESQWKPSDEQMEGIECTIKTLRYQLNAGDNRLNSLYNDLKKLKG